MMFYPLFSRCSEDIDTEAQIQWIVSCLSNIVSHTSLTTDVQTQLNILEYLFMSAFFVVKKTTSKLPHVKNFFFCFFKRL